MAKAKEKLLDASRCSILVYYYPDLPMTGPAAKAVAIIDGTGIRFETGWCYALKDRTQLQCEALVLRAILEGCRKLMWEPYEVVWLSKPLKKNMEKSDRPMFAFAEARVGEEHVNGLLGLEKLVKLAEK